MIYHYNEVATQTTFSKQHCYDKKIKYDITQLQKSSALNPPKIWATNDDAATQTTAPNRLQSGRSLGLRGRLPPLSTLLSAPKTDSQLNDLDRSSRESYLAVNPKISNYVKMVKSWSKLRGRLPLSPFLLFSQRRKRLRHHRRPHLHHGDCVRIYLKS